MSRTTKEPLTASKIKTTPIAVIGIGSIYAQARTTQEYWDNILHKINCVTEVPPSRWEIEDYYDPDPSAPDKTYCKYGAFIPDVDFDPMEYGLPPNILEITDVSQLISLVVAKETLEDAGYGEDRQFDREHTGCILGYVGTSSKIYTPLMTRLQYPMWEKVLLRSGIPAEDTQKIIEKMKLAYIRWEENSFPGAIGNVVSGRVCNRFDLGGTNCVVDAACASSLAAIRMAVAELIEGRAHMMITGGVDTDNTINTYMCFSKTPAFSHSDRVRTFDAESDGMMVGEGLGMVVLKRLEDAERDGDRIYAVIKAIGTSSDGRFKSIYAPRPSGQAIALRRAYDEAGFPAATVGLIEAHGTGTMAGDPAEFAGMREAFSENNSRKQYIALGSVKSQIGHTKAAAGVASLIKTSLALYHKILPPTINVTKPNPKFDIENTPFYINTEARPWIRAQSGYPRRAGVSSFGFGGTNFHVVLEEHEMEHTDAYRVNSVAQPVLLAAANPAQLLSACTAALGQLQGDLANVNFSNMVKESRGLIVPAASARVGFVAETVEEAHQALQICIDSLTSKPNEESWEHPKGIFYRKAGMNPHGKVVALFSGQGSQYVDMGRELAMNFPVVRDVFGAMDELFIQDGLEPLSSQVYPRPVFGTQEKDTLTDALTRTEHAQPAIGSISVSLYKLLQQAGFRPDFVAGHSFGELTALWAGGVLDDQDYYSLAKARGKAMAPPADKDFDAGTMVAVKGEAEKVREALKNDAEVTLANWNSNDQVVIAGSKPAMARAQKTLNDLGFKTIPLTVSAAFHTPLVKHAQKPFAKAIKAAKFNSPQVKVYSNSTAQPHADDPEAIRTLLTEHILNPVLFRDEIQNIYAAGGSIFIEFGPKNVLTNLVGNILAGKPHLAVALNANARKDSDRQLREAVVCLQVAGLPLKGFDPYGRERKVVVPRKKSPVTVKLNGGYYVSEKTRGAFENALKDGFKVSLPAALAASPIPPQAPPPVPQPAAQIIVESSNPVKTNQVQEFNDMANVTPSNLENLLASYQAHQSETLQLHEQYLRTEEEYARAFAQLTQLQTELVSKGAADGLQSIIPLFESLERSMMRFHEHQAETLRIHQRYLETQENVSQAFMQNLQNGSTNAPVIAAGSPVRFTPPPASVRPTAAPVAPSTVSHSEVLAPKNTNGNGAKPVAVPIPQVAPVVSTPVASTPVPVVTPPAAEPTGITTETLKQALLQIVSEKTGYPAETLEFDMDMEADLGIDSIKRVEILGAMQTQFPELPKIDNAVLAEMRTLGQIIDQYGAVSTIPQTVQVVQTAAVPAAVVGTPEAAAPAPAALNAVDSVVITQSLLQIVSDKTGYPVETLELDMDMEADLGIDSIKRVEILGAMQTQFPELPKVDNAALAELRTLRQIIQSMRAAAPEITAAHQAAEPSVMPSSPAMVPSTTAPSGLSVEVLTTAFLQIVSEKTGYPVETLELDMDMEADLGIDSIKRVEILGGIQAQFPELPKIDAVALAEQRTLGQIVNYLSSSASGFTATEPSQGVTVQSPFDGGSLEPEPFNSGIEQGMVIRKVLPSPDGIDFDLPENYTCLITDDGLPTTPALAQALLAKNWPVVVMRMPTNLAPAPLSLPQGVMRVTLTDLSEEALLACLTEVSQKYGPVAVFVHLTASETVGTSTQAVSFAAPEKEMLKLVFLAAKHLKPSLNEAAEKGRSVFMTVTRLDGEFGLSDAGDFDPVQGGLFGLVKTLNLEWDGVFCRAVDLNPAMETAQVVDCILAELHDPNRLVTEVGYNQKERSTLVLASVPVTGNRVWDGGKS